MSKACTLALAGSAALILSCAALAQYGPPPPGSAQGTESGTYGSSIGFDVRGTGTVDRFGRPYDPMDPTDAGSKAAEARLKRERKKAADVGAAAGDNRANQLGASMNPGLSPAYGSGNPSGMSPNLNPGRGAGSGTPAGAAGAPSGANSRGSSTAR